MVKLARVVMVGYALSPTHRWSAFDDGDRHPERSRGICTSFGLRHETLDAADPQMQSFVHPLYPP